MEIALGNLPSAQVESYKGPESFWSVKSEFPNSQKPIPFWQ